MTGAGQRDAFGGIGMVVGFLKQGLLWKDWTDREYKSTFSCKQ